MEGWKDGRNVWNHVRSLDAFYATYSTIGGKVIMEASLSLLSVKLNKILLWRCNATRTGILLKIRNNNK